MPLNKKAKRTKFVKIAVFILCLSLFFLNGSSATGSQTFTPADNASGVSVSEDLTIEFDDVCELAATRF